ncbi:MAG: hypothetical protein NT037_07810 [Hyphomicrobiales bacterium]|nr:hypothetical protein [Hyphomicrobiales bacterium]
MPDIENLGNGLILAADETHPDVGGILPVLGEGMDADGDDEP